MRSCNSSIPKNLICIGWGYFLIALPKRYFLTNLSSSHKENKEKIKRWKIKFLNPFPPYNYMDVYMLSPLASPSFFYFPPPSLNLNSLQLKSSSLISTFSHISLKTYKSCIKSIEIALTCCLFSHLFLSVVLKGINLKFPLPSNPYKFYKWIKLKVF